MAAVRPYDRVHPGPCIDFQAVAVDAEGGAAIAGDGGMPLSNGLSDSCTVASGVPSGQHSAQPHDEQESVRSTLVYPVGQLQFVSEVWNQKHDPGVQHSEPPL